jgi:hypothetical protein
MKQPFPIFYDEFLASFEAVVFNFSSFSESVENTCMQRVAASFSMVLS